MGADVECPIKSVVGMLYGSFVGHTIGHCVFGETNGIDSDAY